MCVGCLFSSRSCEMHEGFGYFLWGSLEEFVNVVPTSVVAFRFNQLLKWKASVRELNGENW